MSEGEAVKSHVWIVEVEGAGGWYPWEAYTSTTRKRAYVKRKKLLRLYPHLRCRVAKYERVKP